MNCRMFFGLIVHNMNFLRCCILYFIATFFLSCSQIPPSDFNLGFENVSNGTIDSWFINPAIKIEVDSILKSEGKYSVILDSMEYIISEHFVLDSTIETLVEVSFDWFLKENAKENAKICLISAAPTDKKNWHYVRDTFSLTPSDSWQTLSDTFHIPTGYDVYDFGLMNLANPSIWIDNVHIQMNHAPCSAFKILTKKEVAQLEQNAIPIEINQAAFEFLEDKVKYKKLVSLGESTHGTKEIFQIKTEIIKYLVQNQDFNIIIFEGSMGGLEKANDFLLEDTIHGVDSAMTQVFGLYQTQEVKALFQWIQDYNKDKSTDKGIILAGCDIQSDETSFMKLKTYAKDKDVILLELLNDYKSEYRVYELLDIVKKIKNRLVKTKENFSDNQFRYYYQHANLLHQFVNFDANIGIRAINRDSCMADNIKWILDSNSETKAIYWAHNRHIKKDNQVRYWSDRNYQRRNNRETTGGFLNSLLENEQYVIGFALKKGFVRAKSNGVYKEDNYLHRIMPYSYEYILSQADEPIYFIDLSTISNLIKTQKYFIEIGAGMNNKYPQSTKYDLGKSFDAVIYIDESSAAVGL